MVVVSFTTHYLNMQVDVAQMLAEISLYFIVYSSIDEQRVYAVDRIRTFSGTLVAIALELYQGESGHEHATPSRKPCKPVELMEFILSLALFSFFSFLYASPDINHFQCHRVCYRFTSSSWGREKVKRTQILNLPIIYLNRILDENTSYMFLILSRIWSSVKRIKWDVPVWRIYKRNAMKISKIIHFSFIHESNEETTNWSRLEIELDLLFNDRWRCWLCQRSL